MLSPLALWERGGGGEGNAFSPRPAGEGKGVRGRGEGRNNKNGGLLSAVFCLYSRRVNPDLLLEITFSTT